MTPFVLSCYMKRLNVPIELPVIANDSVSSPDASHVSLYADANHRLRRRLPNGNHYDIANINLAKTFFVSETGSDFTSLQSLLAFLSANSANYQNGVKIILDAGYYEISDTIVIDLPFGIMIEGMSSNLVTLAAATGLETKPMFDIRSAAFFTKITFDGSALTDWNLSNQASILKLSTSNIFCEITDFVMIGGYTGINCLNNVGIFVFNFILEDCVCGIHFETANLNGELDIEIGNFVNCDTGIDLIQGTAVDLYLSNLRFLHGSAGQIGINYVGANFTYSNFSILTGDFNGIGTLLNGFDFTLHRDADIVIRTMVGTGDKQPKFGVKFSEQTLNTVCSVRNQWYFLNTGTLLNNYQSAIKFNVITDNRIRYLPIRVVDLFMVINANLLATGNNRNIEIGIARYRSGSSTVTILDSFVNRFPTGGQPGLLGFQSLVTDVLHDDDYVLAVRCTNAAGVTVTLTDLSLQMVTH